MSLVKKMQCKGTFQDYQKRQAQRLIKTMTPEARQHLEEVVHARQFLGEQVQNHAVLDVVGRANGKSNSSAV